MSKANARPRLTKAEIVEARAVNLRAEALNAAASLVAGRSGGADDVIRVAGRVYEFLSSGKVPDEVVPDTAAPAH